MTHFTHWTWMGSTRKLQSIILNARGTDYPPAAGSSKMADYMLQQYAAAVKELSELMDGIGWKPWTVDRGWVKRDEVLAEAVDVLHFIANVLAVLDFTDEDIWSAYRAKQVVNERRALSNYRDRRAPVDNEF